MNFVEESWRLGIEYLSTTSICHSSTLFVRDCTTLQTLIRINYRSESGQQQQQQNIQKLIQQGDFLFLGDFDFE